MTHTLFIINDAPYGNERAYNALRLAGALATREGQPVRLFLMADAVTCAKSGQKVPEGYYNVQIMLGKVARKGEVGLCGTCMDARGLRDEELIDGAKRGTLAQLADWTAERRQGAGVLSVRSISGRSHCPATMTPELGVIEGYFGRPWSHDDRKLC
jgi:uncharacterized protein involved in oxidation of intracellular sulfur